MPQNAESASVGDVLPEVRRTVTNVGVFLFGVAHWTAHRIHWDEAYARRAGFNGALVTANLMSAINAELVTAWAGPDAILRRLQERNVGSAVAGDTLVARGKVSAIELTPEGRLATCDLDMSVEGGGQIVVAQASVLLPA